MDADKLLQEEREKSNLSITQEQLQWLMGRLSTDDQAVIKKHFKDCSREMFLTRGLPFTVLGVGSLWGARQILPKNYHFGPKGWSFYVIMGVASITVSSLLTFPSCFDRSKPVLEQLYKKYDQESGAPRTRYDQLREANRHGLSPPDYSQTSYSEKPESQQKVPTSAQNFFIRDEENASSYMSGTPIRPNTSSYMPIDDKNAGTSYGDKEFSA